MDNGGSQWPRRIIEIVSLGLTIWIMFGTTAEGRRLTRMATNRMHYWYRQAWLNTKHWGDPAWAREKEWERTHGGWIHLPPTPNPTAK